MIRYKNSLKNRLIEVRLWCN